MSTQTKIIFTFHKPSEEPTLGGYYLYMSSTGTTFTHVYTRIDADQTQDDSEKTYDIAGLTYFEYTIPYTTTEGRLLYFKLTWISTSMVESSFSATVTAYTYPSDPENLFVIYNGIQVDLTWDALDFTNNRNATFLNYNVYRDRVSAINGSTYDSTTEKLSNTAFTVDMYVWVIDKFKRSQWWGKVTTAGEFDLSTTKITQQSDNVFDSVVKIDNLEIFKEYGSPTLIGTPTSPLFTDTTYDNDIHYIYSVTSDALEDRESNSLKYKCYPILMAHAYPYLRSVENSSTGLLVNPYWRKLKDVLIDKHYYDKSAFAIPYSKSTPFQMKGYLGVSNCTVDIYVNDKYSSAVTSDNYGEFQFYYTFPKENIELKFRSRDHLNIGISRISAPYSIHTLNIYTWYALLGNQYQQMVTELDAIIDDVSMQDCRYSYFEDKYSPFIELYKQGAEDDTKFKNIAIAAYQAFEYTSFDKSIDTVLDAFETNVDEFDHYEIYYNNSLYNPKYTGKTFVCKNPSLVRDDYYYAVTSATYAGEETIASEIRADKRWWPATYDGYNVLMWDYMPDAEFYKIYRGTSSTGIYYLGSTPNNIYVDGNYNAVDVSKTPPEYNFTDIEKPTNLFLYKDVFLDHYIEKQKRKSKMLIILFALENETIPEYQVTRIRQLLYKIIAPEMIYTILVSNNTGTTLYNGGAVS